MELSQKQRKAVVASLIEGLPKKSGYGKHLAEKLKITEAQVYAIAKGNSSVSPEFINHLLEFLTAKTCLEFEIKIKRHDGL